MFLGPRGPYGEGVRRGHRLLRPGVPAGGARITEGSWDGPLCPLAVTLSGDWAEGGGFFALIQGWFTHFPAGRLSEPASGI